MYCQQCGYHIQNPDARFCPVCGAQITGEPHAATPEVESAPSAADVPPTPPPAMPPGGGTPWEDARDLGILGRLVETVSAVLFRPTRFFREMSVDAGLGRPLLFGALLSSVAGIIGAVWAFTLDATLAPFLEEIPQGMMTLVGIMVLIFVPVFAVIGIFLRAGILHLCLMIVGGARREFEASFRVVCYGSATEIFQIIPMVGGFIGLIWMVVVYVIGFSQAHRTTWVRALIAILIPLAVCCVCVVVYLSAIGLFAASALEGFGG